MNAWVALEVLGAEVGNNCLNSTEVKVGIYFVKPLMVMVVGAF